MIFALALVAAAIIALVLVAPLAGRHANERIPAVPPTVPPRPRRRSRRWTGHARTPTVVSGTTAWARSTPAHIERRRSSRRSATPCQRGGGTSRTTRATTCCCHRAKTSPPSTRGSATTSVSTPLWPPRTDARRRPIRRSERRHRTTSGGCSSSPPSSSASRSRSWSEVSAAHRSTCRCRRGRRARTPTLPVPSSRCSSERTPPCSATNRDTRARSRRRPHAVSSGPVRPPRRHAHGHRARRSGERPR